MSVGGTAAVLTAARRLDESAPRSWPRAARAARTLLGINAAIAVALWPLFASTFGRGSVVGPFANIVLVPVAAGLMGVGASLWVIDSCAPMLAPFVARTTDIGLAAFEHICTRASSLSWAAVQLRPWKIYEVVAYALFLGAVLSWPRRDTASKMRRPARVAGAYVVFVDSEPVLYLERGGRGILTLAPWSTLAPALTGAQEGRAPVETPRGQRAPLAAALGALAEAVRAGRVDAVALERVDGEPVVGSEIEPALVELGFRQGPRRLTLRA